MGFLLILQVAVLKMVIPLRVQCMDCISITIPCMVFHAVSLNKHVCFKRCSASYETYSPNTGRPSAIALFFFPLLETTSSTKQLFLGLFTNIQ